MTDRVEQRAAWRWAAIILGLLALSVGANVFLMSRAVGDPAFAVEPDYYQRAVHWDEEQSQARASEELGWKASLEAVAVEDARPERAVELTLLDHTGAPVGDAEVRVVALHVANAGERVPAPLAEVAPGHYRAIMPLGRAGLWEIQIEARRGLERFIETRRLELGPLPGGG